MGVDSRIGNAWVDIGKVSVALPGPKILTLLGNFDEILTLLGPYSAICPKSLPYSAFICTQLSNFDQILTLLALWSTWTSPWIFRAAHGVLREWPRLGKGISKDDRGGALRCFGIPGRLLKSNLDQGSRSISKRPPRSSFEIPLPNLGHSLCSPA